MEGIIQPGNFSDEGSLIVTGNIIRNMVSNHNVTGLISMRGIGLFASADPAVTTVSQNTIHSLSNIVAGGGLTAVYGMDWASRTRPMWLNAISFIRVSNTSVNTGSQCAEFG